MMMGISAETLEYRCEGIAQGILSSEYRLDLFQSCLALKS